MNGRHSPSSTFESGVIKIQNDDVGSMTVAERSACSTLLAEENTQETITQDEGNGNHELLGFIARKKRRVDKRYINCSFLLGSTAEMERVRSFARQLLLDNRKHMEPVVFESLLFLKVNRTYWDISSLKLVMAAVRTASGTNQ